MTNIATVCNQKGGVGKTALTINLGAALAEEAKKVLLIDRDPQGHLTEGVSMKHLYLQEGHNLYKALTDHKDVTQSLIHHVPHEKFSIIPSNYEMMLAEQTLFMTRNREHKLRALLAEITGFDWILIDCPPQSRKFNRQCFKCFTTCDYSDPSRNDLSTGPGPPI